MACRRGPFGGVGAIVNGAMVGAALNNRSSCNRRGCNSGTCNQSGTSATNPFDIDQKHQQSQLQIGLVKDLLRDPDYPQAITDRQKLLYQMMEVLARTKKANVLLVGAAGVGKSTLVQGLAYHMQTNSVIKQLADHHLWALDVNQLKAGTGVVGSIEEKLQQLYRQIEKSQKPVILFIDEIHQIAGANQDPNNSAIINFLKPLLTSDFVRIIGATTTNEYQSIFAKDQALERRFSVLNVDQLSERATVELLKTMWPKLLANQAIDENLLKQLVALSVQYLPNRVLPDKAIDVFDQAVVIATSEANEQSYQQWNQSVNPNQNDTEDKLLIDQEEQDDHKALSEDQAEYEKLLKTQEQIRQKYNQLVLNKKNISEKEFVKISNQYKEINAQVGAAKQTLNRGDKKHNGDLITVEQANFEQNQAQNQHQVVVNLKIDHVKQVLAALSGLPIDRLQTTGVLIKADLKQAIIGQDHVVAKLDQAVQAWFANINDPQRPIASFLFAGPSGVGKSAIGKALANLLFVNEQNQKWYQVDCSEFNSPGDLSKILGASAGYIGYGDQGGLVGFVQANPYSVIIFDEIEKARDQAIFNVLLRILDEGTLIDHQNRQINFKNTIIIMTTNIGANLDFDIAQANPLLLKDLLVEHGFRIEFLNRINHLINFRHLDQQDLITISKLIGKKWSDWIYIAHQIKIIIDDEAIYPYLVATFHTDHEAAARGLEYAIKTGLNDFIAPEIIKRELKPNVEYHLKLVDGVLGLVDGTTGKFAI